MMLVSLEKVTPATLASLPSDRRSRPDRTPLLYTFTVDRCRHSEVLLLRNGMVTRRSDSRQDEQQPEGRRVVFLLLPASGSKSAVALVKPVRMDRDWHQ